MKRLLVLIALSAIGLLATAPIAGAWNVQQSASAVCVDNAVSLKASFTNHDEHAMNVLIRFDGFATREIVGIQSGASTGTIVVETGNSQIDATMVSFELTWNDGDTEIDARFVEVSALRCETPTTTVTTVAPTTTAPTTTTTAPTTTTTTEAPEYGLIPPISIVREPLASSAPELAYTGAGHDIAMIIIALLLIGAGAGLFRFAEKRKNQ